MGTARDVAERAGVSTSTVSHVLNNTRWVSPDLRERVLSATQDLGYEPNAVARSLKIKRSNTLGLVISDIGNPFFTAVVRGVEDVAQERGYTIILCNSDEDPAKEAAYLRILAARRVDGLILAPAGVRHDHLVRLARAHFPLVFLDREVPALPMTSVMLDNEIAARDGVRHLIRLGHRRIAMVAGRPLITSTIDRIAGYRHALEEAGIPVDDRLIVSGGSRTEPARLASDVVLDVDPRPTAFFVANNLMTIGAVAAIQGRGLAIPRDIALVGFDDFSWADVFRPRLTTVAQPTYELGRTAAELLVARIAGEPESPPERVVLPGRLVIRESCGTTPGRAARGGAFRTRRGDGMSEGSPGGWPSVVCQGELLIDLLAIGPDQTIDGAMTFRKAPGGAPANVAVGLARLGTPTGFIGKVSSDAFGRFLRTTLEADGVDVRGLVTDPDARTPLAFVGLDGARGRSFIFYHRGMADTILRPEEVDAELIGHARAFHFGSVSLAAEPGRSATLAGARIAREGGCLVSFDPNVRLELWDSPEGARSSILASLPLADVAKVSGDETRLLFGTDDPAEACRAIRAVGPTLAIVTLGPDGSYFQAAAAEGHVPGFAVAAVDPTGAGDAFVACLLSELVASGASPDIAHDKAALTAAIRFANAGGALATTAYGAIPSLPTRREVQALVDRTARADAPHSTTTPADVRTGAP